MLDFQWCIFHTTKVSVGLWVSRTNLCIVSLSVRLCAIQITFGKWIFHHCSHTRIRCLALAWCGACTNTTWANSICATYPTAKRKHPHTSVSILAGYKIGLFHLNNLTASQTPETQTHTSAREKRQMCGARRYFGRLGNRIDYICW